MWSLSKRVGVEQIFLHTFPITGHLQLQGFRDLRKVALHLALYIALNQFLFYMALLLLSDPKASDLPCDGMWWMLELSCRLCEGPAPSISFEPATC